MSIIVTKSLSIDYIIPGDVVTCTIEVENTSSKKFLNAILYDYLSKCTQYLFGTLYIDDKLSFDYPAVGIKLGDIDKNQSKIIKFNLFIDYDTCECTIQPNNTNPITNQAYVVGYFENEPPLQGRYYSNITNLRVFCYKDEDFSFEKSYEKNGNIITYTLVAKNKSPIYLIGADFSDQLDPCTEIVPGSWQQSNGSKFPFTMGPNSTVTVVFKSKIINSCDCMNRYKRDYISNEALWSYGIRPPYFKTDIQYQTDVIQPSNLVTIPISCENLNLKIEKEVCKCKICVDEKIPYTIKITNTGSVDLTNIIVEDIIPEGMYVYSMESQTGTMYEENKNVIWNIDKLEAKEIATAMIIMIATNKLCLDNNEYIINTSRIISYNGITTIKDMHDTVITNIDCSDCNCYKKGR